MVSFYIMGAVVSPQELSAIKITGNNVTLVALSSDELMIYFCQPCEWDEFTNVCTLRNIQKDSNQLKQVIGSDLWKNVRWRIHKLEDNSGRFMSNHKISNDNHQELIEEHNEGEEEI